MSTVHSLPKALVVQALRAHAAKHVPPAVDGLPADMPASLRALALRRAELDHQLQDLDDWYQAAQERLEDTDIALRSDRLRANGDPHLRVWIDRALEPYLSDPTPEGSRVYVGSPPEWLSRLTPEWGDDPRVDWQAEARASYPGERWPAGEDG